MRGLKHETSSYQVVRQEFFLLAAGGNLADETFRNVLEKFDTIDENLTGVDENFALEWFWSRIDM